MKQPSQDKWHSDADHHAGGGESHRLTDNHIPQPWSLRSDRQGMPNPIVGCSTEQAISPWNQIDARSTATNAKAGEP